MRPTRHSLRPSKRCALRSSRSTASSDCAGRCRSSEQGRSFEFYGCGGMPHYNAGAERQRFVLTLLDALSRWSWRPRFVLTSLLRHREAHSEMSADRIMIAAAFPIVIRCVRSLAAPTHHPKARTAARTMPFLPHESPLLRLSRPCAGEGAFVRQSST